MALTFDLGVAVGLGVAGLVATLGPFALAFALWRRAGASLKAWGFGALTFVVSQLVLRLPWQIPLNAYLAKHYAADAVVMGAWLVASCLTAGLFEELGRLVTYRTLWKDRSTLGGVMLGAGHGGIESVLLVGLTLVANTVLYVLLANGVSIGLPPEAQALVEQQFGALDFWKATMGGVERVSAMALHIACSLLVLEGARRRRWTWVVGAIALHAASNLVAVVVTQQAGVYLGELALAVVVAPALALALRSSRASEALPT